MKTPSSIEPLESRIAPSSVLYFTDVDGDRVRIYSSSDTGTLAPGNVLSSPSGAGFQLETLILDATFALSNISITATKSATGDGLVNVGRIDATGVDLGRVSVDGDLAVIDAGSGDALQPALKSLHVRSMGTLGLATQGLVVPDLESNIAGAVGKLWVKTDVKDAFISITGGTFATLGRVFIGGSLIGGADSESGRIYTEGDIGPVRIVHDLLGSSGDYSGTIETASNADIASLTIGGSVLADATRSGSVFADGALGMVRIGGDVRGGDGANSGNIEGGDGIAGAFIGGSVVGGVGFFSGAIFMFGDVTDKLGRVTIHGDLVGGSGTEAGRVESAGELAGVTIYGSLLGGTGSTSGWITSEGDMGPVKILGDLKGGSISGTTGNLGESGLISSVKRIASVFIRGSIVSGTDTSTGGDLSSNASIRAGDDIGSLIVRGSLVGNDNPDGYSPVTISARGQAFPSAAGDFAIGKIRIGGDLDHALVFAGYDPGVDPANPAASLVNTNAQIGSFHYGGDWIASSVMAGA